MYGASWDMHFIPFSRNDPLTNDLVHKAIQKQNVYTKEIRRIQIKKVPNIDAHIFNSTIRHWIQANNYKEEEDNPIQSIDIGNLQSLFVYFYEKYRSKVQEHLIKCKSDICEEVSKHLTFNLKPHDFFVLPADLIQHVSPQAYLRDLAESLDMFPDINNNFNSPPAQKLKPEVSYLSIAKRNKVVTPPPLTQTSLSKVNDQHQHSELKSMIQSLKEENNR